MNTKHETSGLAATAKERSTGKRTRLIPPDRLQCQRVHLVGAWPDAQHFMEIGPREQRRCVNKPIAIVYETRPAKDGLKGSMSLCGTCLAECLESYPDGHLKVVRLKELTK